MSQWDYFGGVTHEIGGSGLPLPISELDTPRTEEERAEWIEKYIYMII